MRTKKFTGSGPVRAPFVNGIHYRKPHWHKASIGLG